MSHTWIIRGSLTMLVASLLLGCESRESLQLKRELAIFGNEYVRLYEEREGDVDWESMQPVREQFPNLAAKIDQRAFDVVWHAELDQPSSSEHPRALAFNSFGLVQGGLVLFRDGSVKNVSASDFEKILYQSSQPDYPPSIKLQRSDKPYVDTNVAGVRMPLPDGAAFNGATKAYFFHGGSELLQVQTIHSEYESTELALEMSLKRMDAKNLKKQTIDHDSYRGLFCQCSVFPKGSGPRGERHLWLLLSEGKESILVAASLPIRSPRIEEFRKCLLATEWGGPGSE